MSTGAREALVRPPRLRGDDAGGASRLELFFDLAYVLVVLELAEGLYTDLTWHGLAVLVGLFVAVWFSWVGYTLYANRFDTDDVVFRLAKLAATGAVAGCAAAASDAVGKYALYFAASFLLGRLILLLLYVRAWRHIPDGRPTIEVYLVASSVSSLLWAASLVVPEPARYWLWAAAVLPDVLAPVVATRRSDRLPLHVEHLPERFGLFIILVLGEALGGAVRGVHDASWAGPSLVVGVLGLVLASGLWWIYFDVAATSSTPRLASPDRQAETSEAIGAATGAAGGASTGSDNRHDLFVYGHLPLAFGAVLVGVGLEDLAVHLNTEADWLLAGGLALFLAGIALVVGGTSRSWRSVWPWPLLFVPLALLLPLVAYPAAIVVVAVFAALVLVLAVHGTIARRTPDTVISG